MKSGNTTGNQESKNCAGDRRESGSRPLGEVIKKLKLMEESGALIVNSEEPRSSSLPETEDDFSPPPPEDSMVEVPSSTEDQDSSPDADASEDTQSLPDQMRAFANTIKRQLKSPHPPVTKADPNPSKGTQSVLDQMRAMAEEIKGLRAAIPRPIALRDLASRDSSFGNHRTTDSDSESEEEVHSSGQDHSDSEQNQVSAHSIRYSRPLKDIKRGLAAQHLKLARAKIMANPANLKPVQTPTVFPTNPWSDDGGEKNVFEPRVNPLRQLMGILYGDETWTGRRILEEMSSVREGGRDIGKPARRRAMAVSQPLAPKSIAADGELCREEDDDGEGSFWHEM